MSRADGMLKMSELARRSGVSAGTIKHYLREGVLGPGDEIVRTSRNMAWYPESFVARIRLVKRLQEQRFMPLRVIRELVGSDPERAARLVALEDRIAEALEPLVRDEVAVLLERLSGEVDIERDAGIVASGAEPLRELIGAVHSKLLQSELRRQRGSA